MSFCGSHLVGSVICTLVVYSCRSVDGWRIYLAYNNVVASRRLSCTPRPYSRYGMVELNE
jgi:hypothetical protein